jgi:hypothetical protein
MSIDLILLQYFATTVAAEYHHCCLAVLQTTNAFEEMTVFRWMVLGDVLELGAEL